MLHIKPLSETAIAAKLLLRDRPSLASPEPSIAALAEAIDRNTAALFFWHTHYAHGWDPRYITSNAASARQDQLLTSRDYCRPDHATHQTAVILSTAAVTAYRRAMDRLVEERTRLRRLLLAAIGPELQPAAAALYADYRLLAVRDNYPNNEYANQLRWACHNAATGATLLYPG